MGTNQPNPITAPNARTADSSATTGTQSPSAHASPRQHPPRVDATPPQSPAAHPPDFDLPCLKCGYNLRGLAGDPIKCPECGYENPFGDAAVPKAALEARLRKTETSLAICVGAILFGTPPAALLAVIWWETLRDPTGFSFFPWSPVICAGLPTLSAVIAWCTAAYRFGISCGGTRGWVRQLVHYHFWGLGLACAIIALGIAVGVACTPGRQFAQPWDLLASAILFAAIIASVVFYFPAAHRRLMMRIHDLQRETAIARIREEARLRLAAQGRRD